MSSQRPQEQVDPEDCLREQRAKHTHAQVMQQLGHTDPKMTLGLYAKALTSKRRRPHAQRGEQAPDWAPLGTTNTSQEFEGDPARVA